MTDVNGRAEYAFGFDSEEEGAEDLQPVTSREDLESAVQAVDDSAEGYIRVEDVMDDRDTLSEMVEATCSEGEWSLSFYDEGAKFLDADSPEDVVKVLWQFATADKAFLGRDWSAGYQAAPFEVETDEHELIPIQEGGVEEVLQALEAAREWIQLDERRPGDLLAELNIQKQGEGFALKYLYEVEEESGVHYLKGEKTGASAAEVRGLVEAFMRRERLDLGA